MNKKKVKKYKDNDFYFVSFKKPPFLHREDLKELTKEELIKLFIESENRSVENSLRVLFLKRLIEYLGYHSKSKIKPNKELFFKMEYVRIYKKLYRKFKNHSKTASNLDKDEDFKLLQKFGSISKRWIGDNIKKKEEEGEIRNYIGHTKRYYRFHKELLKERYSEPPINAAELKQWKEDQKYLDSHPDPLDG